MNTTMSKLALAIGALVMAGGAMAVDSGSGTMAVSAAIVNECSVSTGSPLAFGDLSMLAAGLKSAAASVSIGGGAFDAICTSGAPAPKFKFTSLNAGATSTFRMIGATDPSQFIAYTLKEASGGTADIVYGTAAAFTGFTANGITQNLTIAGSITAGEKETKKVQTYSDTITVLSSYTP